MELHNPSATVFVPDHTDVAAALHRTTHMGIGAHPDDLPIMAYHGIAECLGWKDRWFLGVTVTSGTGGLRAGRFATATDDEMRAIRIDEEQRAADLGEYSAAVMLDYTSEKPKDPTANEVTADLAALVQATEPDVVYTHSLADAHDTHVAVALRTVEALRSLPSETRPLRVYGCEVWRDLDWLIEPDKIVLADDIGDDHLLEMLEMYESQLVAKRFDTATIGRRRANATFGHSHRTDDHRSATLAMDLTPLVHEPNLDPDDLVVDAIERLRNDVLDRINRLRAGR